MFKRKNTENVSEDAKKKPSLDTAGQSSSVDAVSEHLFNVSESTVARTEAANGSPTLDTYDLDTTDTLTLARMHRETQGPWEAEYSYGGEADLHRHYHDCTKNPGHKNFIPVDKFSIENLPEGCRDPNVVDYIRAVSDLTVRVTVRYVSDMRPTTVPGSDKPYPFYAKRGQHVMTVGTGWVYNVYFNSNDHTHKCRCKDCGNSSTRKSWCPFAQISIKTANHVVFDETEAKHTTCHLYFDNGGTPDTCSGAITLTGMSCVYTERELDTCFLIHCTHDLELANRLEHAWKRLSELEKTLPNQLTISNYRRRRIAPDQQPLLFIVSHPHGCSKQISLGRLTSLKRWSMSNSCQYTTATCPGSSGAHIIVPLNYSFIISHQRLLERPIGNHYGASDEQSVINYGHIYNGKSWCERELELVQVWPRYDESFGDNLGCIDEEDLHKRVDTCQKNPARLNVYPVDKFSMDNLPPSYRYNETMEAIKSMSDLTVQVSVTCVSEERPKTVPGTDIPYPWYKTRGGNQMRVGSARIFAIDIPSRDYLSTPWCRECKGKLPKRPGHAYIFVRSSACLIYDSKEAEHTTCRLFFDSGETPDLCNDVVTVTDMVHYCKHDMVHYCNDGIVDECMMVYGINDLTLAERIADMIDKCEDCVLSFRTLYGTDSEIETHMRSSHPYIPEGIMVSHPHGSAKQITVLYAGNHDNGDANENQSHHVSITCPGSVGAPVIALRQETFYPCYV